MENICSMLSISSVCKWYCTPCLSERYGYERLCLSFQDSEVSSGRTLVSPSESVFFSEPSHWSALPLLRILKVSLDSHLRPGSSSWLKSSPYGTSWVAGRHLCEFVSRSLLSKSLSNNSNRPGEIKMVRIFFYLNRYACSYLISFIQVLLQAFWFSWVVSVLTRHASGSHVHFMDFMSPNSTTVKWISIVLRR
jgi:hypothetical protein